MPKRKSPFPEKPWKPDPAKWVKHLRRPAGDTPKQVTPDQPVGGWMLFDWKTLEDAKQ